MASSMTVVQLTDEDRLTLACALMSGTPGQWAYPPEELIERLLGAKLGKAVLDFRFSADVLRIAAASAAVREDA